MKGLRCRRHGKYVFGSEEAANQELARIAEEENPDGHKIPVRSYAANCGFYHLTSKEAKR